MRDDSLFSLESRIVLVTGAGTGLGRHFARALSRAGATVALAGRRVEKLETVAAEIRQHGGRVLCISLDVTDERGITDAVGTIERQAGVIDVLINNAGTNAPRPAIDMPLDDWDSVLDTNLRGCFLVAREIARRLIHADQPGSIVNVGSVLGLRTQKGVSAYMASKAGLLHLTHGLAVEWARYHIRVNALLPGYFRTELTEEFLNSEAGVALTRSIPQRRIGEPADLTGPLLLLASAASGFMTGSAIVVDGGQCVGSM
jgi:NAD(P)-dependent dehydrogenase (short-subunit alcohol dehydrogenase family)